MEQLSLIFPDEKQPKKRKHVATSKEAYESIKDSRQIMYDKIILGMVRLANGGTFEEIAMVSGIKPEQCWKRLSEMVEKGILYNTGEVRKTSSGRSAMVRQLTVIKK